MKTIPANHPGITSVMLGALFMVSIIVVFRTYFVAHPPPVHPAHPTVDLEDGRQLELPFKDEDLYPKGAPEPKAPDPVPMMKNKRYDEDRLGTCIVYALVALSSEEYHIPGCYGKPDSWKFIEKGTILKVGRHWNPVIAGCGSLETLSSIVRNTRYASDNKFKNAEITIRVGGELIEIPMLIEILDCIEEVTEKACEFSEKQYIQKHGGSKKLFLNCCCR